MRIISPQHDYYDGLSDGASPLVYVRRPIHIKIKRSWRGRMFPRRLLYPDLYDSAGLQYDIITVGFCGKLYHFLHLCRAPMLGMPDARVHVCQITADCGMYTCVMQSPFEDRVRMWLKDRRRIWARCSVAGKINWGMVATMSATYDADHWEMLTNATKPLLPLFRQYKTPVFVAKLRAERGALRVTINGLIGDTGMASVMPVQECYQAIAYYVGNDLVQRDDPDQIKDDKVLRDAKGFDDRSFKRPPKKRKARGIWR